MQRYFIEGSDDQSTVTINGDDFHHMTRVMRMNQGDTFYGVINKKTAIVIIKLFFRFLGFINIKINSLSKSLK